MYETICLSQVILSYVIKLSKPHIKLGQIDHVEGTFFLKQNRTNEANEIIG